MLHAAKRMSTPNQRTVLQKFFHMKLKEKSFVSTTFFYINDTIGDLQTKYNNGYIIYNIQHIQSSTSNNSNK